MRRPIHILALAALLAAWPGPSGKAWDFSQDVSVFGYFQTWLTLYEQMQEADELYQYPSHDLATDQTTGFSIRRARVGAHVYVLDRLLGFHTQIKLEKDPAILDLYANLPLADWVEIRVGQFKIPSTYESLTLSSDLDFIQRTLLAERIADYALSRTVHPSSLFYGNRVFFRDLGAAVRGTVDLGPGQFRYFLMVGNGLGANLYIGGNTHREFILTNPPQFFTGLRLELANWFDIVSLGGHVTWNEHTDMVYNSGRTVYDLRRLSWSADAHLKIPLTGLRLAGMVGGGKVDDDYDDNDEPDLVYAGWEARLVFAPADIRPLLDLLPWLEHHRLSLGFRIDVFESEWNGNGGQVRETTYTLGLNYDWREYIRLMLDLAIRETDDPALADLDDNIIWLSAQFAI